MKKKNEFKELQKKTYAQLAKDFDKVQKRENRNHYNKIKKIKDFLDIKDNDKVLEIGIGTGIHAEYLLNNCHKKFTFYGIDLSKEMLLKTRKKLGNKKNVKLKVMDGESLKFKEDSFNKIYISGSLHHYDNPEKGILEILRVLKKGGKFCIMEPNYIFPTNLYSAKFIKEEKNMKFMRRKNFIKWLSNRCVNFKLINFAYTPPFPRILIPMYNILDKILVKIPILNKFSVMLFISGKKAN
tara:strand:+ start:231 stop:950 length:720 start_codon:yes stop_codon:yes gene_type:complete